MNQTGKQIKSTSTNIESNGIVVKVNRYIPGHKIKKHWKTITKDQKYILQTLLLMLFIFIAAVLLAKVLYLELKEVFDWDFLGFVNDDTIMTQKLGVEAFFWGESCPPVVPPLNLPPTSMSKKSMRFNRCRA